MFEEMGRGMVGHGQDKWSREQVVSIRGGVVAEENSEARRQGEQGGRLWKRNTTQGNLGEQGEGKEEGVLRQREEERREGGQGATQDREHYSGVAGDGMVNRADHLHARVNFVVSVAADE